MALGKTIRIYLADGTASGVKHGEIANWTGQAIACPRARFQELREWPEAKRPGVYFLFGTDEETGQESVYVGEAEVVIDRLLSHITGKDFWSELIAFTNKDDNLTKGHVRYLESRIVEMALNADRYLVKNSNAPQLPSLPRADRDAMEEYLDATRTLLGVLGHKVLEPLVSIRQTQDKQISGSSASDSLKAIGENTSEPFATPVVANFKLHTSGLSAYATKTDEGLVVLEGSEAACAVQPSLSVGYRALRDKLIQTGVLTQHGASLKFVRNHLFNSPSQAGAIVVGYSINGRDVWRLPDGTTYGAYEERLARRLE